MRQTKWMTAAMIRNGRICKKEEKRNKCVSQYELIQCAPPTVLSRFQRLLTMPVSNVSSFFVVVDK